MAIQKTCPTTKSRRDDPWLCENPLSSALGPPPPPPSLYKKAAQNKKAVPVRPSCARACSSPLCRAEGTERERERNREERDNLKHLSLGAPPFESVCVPRALIFNGGHAETLTLFIGRPSASRKEAQMRGGRMCCGDLSSSCQKAVLYRASVCCHCTRYSWCTWACNVFLSCSQQKKGTVGMA